MKKKKKCISILLPKTKQHCDCLCTFVLIAAFCCRMLSHQHYNLLVSSSPQWPSTPASSSCWSQQIHACTAGRFLSAEVQLDWTILLTKFCIHDVIYIPTVIIWSFDIIVLNVFIAILLHTCHYKLRQHTSLSSLISWFITVLCFSSIRKVTHLCMMKIRWELK